MLYSLLTVSSRHALRWCYRDVEVVGKLPKTGPLLLAVNHPNDLADICAVLAHVPRRVNFVANVSASEQRIVAWAYRRMGVVPVHRVRDARKAKARGEDSAQANALAFRRVRDVLAQGGCVCVFPEGGVNSGSHLGALRNGLARMALEARDHGAVRNVRIVPVGLTYEARYVQRTRLLMEFGQAIAMDEWQAGSSRPAEPQLTATIATAMRAVTCNAPDEDAALGMRAITMVVAAASPRRVDPMHVAAQAWRQIAADTYGPGIARPVLENPRVTPAVALVRAVEQALPDVSAERALIAWRATDGRLRLASGLHVPVALLGGVLHLPAWQLIASRARTAALKSTEFIPRLIVPGLYMLLAWYLVLAAAATAFARWSGASVVGAVLTGLFLLIVAPRLGDTAMRTWDWWQDRALAKRLHAQMPALREQLDTAANTVCARADDCGDLELRVTASPARNVAQPI